MEQVTASRAEARTGSRWPCPSPCAALLLSSSMATPRKPCPVAAPARTAGSGSPIPPVNQHVRPFHGGDLAAQPVQVDAERRPGVVITAARGGLDIAGVAGPSRGVKPVVVSTGRPEGNSRQRDASSRVAGHHAGPSG